MKPTVASAGLGLLLPCLIICQLLTDAAVAQGITNRPKNIGRDGRPGHTFTEKELLDMLLTDYDNKIRPRTVINGSDVGIVVKINMLIRSITSVDEEKMEYTAQVTFRQEWNDERLAYDDGGHHPFLIVTDKDLIWKPDLFFQNERSGYYHNLLVPNVLVRIHPNGDVMMSVRLTMTFGCPMSLQYFPMDRQTCEIRMASYSYTIQDINFAWKDVPKAGPVQLAPSLVMPRFQLEGVRPGDCSSHTTTGSYSCLKVQFFLQRQTGYYVSKIYLPTALIIAVSWISFWLNPEATVGRALLGVTTLLATIVTLWDVNSHLPVVSYTKAIDVWSSMCAVFVVSAVIEFVLVNHLYQQRLVNQRHINDAEQASALLISERQDPNKRPRIVHVQRRAGPLQMPSDLAGKLDFISRFLFPGVFLLFNVIYWPTCYGSVADFGTA